MCLIGSAHLQRRAFPRPRVKRAADRIETRAATLDKAIEDAILGWHFAPVVDAWRALAA